MNRRVISIALLAVANVAVATYFLLQRASGTHAAWTGLPLDDAWIHLVYARSVASGHGFAYNPGQAEAGFTSPAWVCLLVPLFWLKAAAGGSLVVWVKALGVALGAVLSVACARAARSLSGGRISGLLAGALVAIEPCLAFGRVSGMETTLAAICAVAIGIALVERRARWLALATAIGVLARPEMVVVVAFAFVAVLADVRRGAAQRAHLLAFLAPLLAALAWSARCLAVTGRPLPNALYVKGSAPALDTLGANLATTARALGDTVTFCYGLGAVLLAAGVLAAFRHRPDRRTAVVFAVVAPVAFAIAVAASRAMPQWRPFYWGRYWQPALPLLITVAAVGAEMALRTAWKSAAPPAPPSRRRALDVVCLLVLGVAAFRVGPALREAAGRYSWNCQNVNEMQVRAARWARAHTASGESIATSDAGAIRFLGGRDTIDLTGLNEHRILDGDLAAVLAEARPRLFIVFPAWFPNLLTSGRYEIVRRFAAGHYTICDCPQDELVVLTRRRRSSRPPEDPSRALPASSEGRASSRSSQPF